MGRGELGSAEEEERRGKSTGKQGMQEGSRETPLLRLQKVTSW